MNRFLLLLVLISQFVVAVREDEIGIINCQTDGDYMFCEEDERQKKESEEIEKIKRQLMEECEQFIKSSIITISEDGKESTYCVVNNSTTSKDAIGAVIDSSVTNLENAHLLTTDQDNNIQYDFISSTTDNGLEPLFDGDLLQEFDGGLLQEEETSSSHVVYICKECSEAFQVLKDLNEHKSKCKKRKKRKNTEPDGNKPPQKKKKIKETPYQCGQCGRAFALQGQLTQHQKQSHATAD